MCRLLKMQWGMNGMLRNLKTQVIKGLTNLRKKDIVNETNKIVNNFSIINYAFLIRIRHQMLSFQI